MTMYRLYARKSAFGSPLPVLDHTIPGKIIKAGRAIESIGGIASVADVTLGKVSPEMTLTGFFEAMCPVLVASESTYARGEILLRVHGNGLNHTLARFFGRDRFLAYVRADSIEAFNAEKRKAPIGTIPGVKRDAVVDFGEDEEE